MTEPLKACPFCGSPRPDIVTNYPKAMVVSYAYECNKCGCRTPWSTSELLARSAWNTRAQAEDGEAVAWLHDVVQGDGEPEQALSFMRDSFPLEGELGFRSLGAIPLYTHPSRAQGDGEDVRDAEVFVCSNPKCDAVYARDPQGHCPKCIASNGSGYSTARRDVL